jgi:predicted TIM-barrel fold metal-dependent hydrolase
MAQLPFVDTHVHFYDFTEPDLRWVWLEPDFVHPQLGNIDPIKARTFPLEAFIAESRLSNVPKAVHVQAAIGTEDPVKETAWLQRQADELGYPLAIVADASLRDPDLAATLERHLAFPGMRGVRDFAEGDYLVDDDWARGYALLGEHDLVCDLDCTWEGMTKARDLARAHPGTTMVLDHAGFPQERTEEYFRSWQQGITTLAEAESAVVKISGLGMKDPAWTVESIRPWVLHCIEAFGVERAFFGTNWPVDRLFSSYADVVDAYDQITADFSDDERTALFSGTAERVYRF